MRKPYSPKGRNRRRWGGRGLISPGQRVVSSLPLAGPPPNPRGSGVTNSGNADLPETIQDPKPSEQVALGLRLEELERERALKRMSEAGMKSAPGKPAEHPEESTGSSTGSTRDIVGAALGVAHLREGDAPRYVDSSQRERSLPEPSARR